jgi:exodeoxyribonuclease VII large subunit
MNDEKMRIQQISQKLPTLFAVLKVRQEQLLDNIWTRAHNGVRNVMTEREYRLGIIDKVLTAADPVLILKRGFSLTRCDGHTVQSVSDLKRGDRLTTIFADGSVESEII